MPPRQLLGALGRVRDRVQALGAIEFSPVLPPWSALRNSATPVGRLRSTALHLGPLARTSLRKRALLTLVSVIWPARAGWDSVRGALRTGAAVRREGGPGRMRQLIASLSAAYRWNVSPRTYYRMRLWDPANGLTPASIIQPGELILHQSTANRELDVGRVADKARFEEMCVAHSIPVARTVGVLEGPRAVEPAEPWPRRDLFVKEAHGEQGAGAQRWEFDRDSGRWTRDALSYDEQELLAHLDAHRNGRVLLVQECLQNHPELAVICGSTLSTFRVITCLGDGGNPVVPCVALKVGREGAEVDNMHAGGVVCAVDQGSGRLKAGVTHESVSPVVAHADTGEVLEGRTLTHHREVIDLAVRAHRELPGLPWTVGWDVALTPQGAVLVEANSMWGADLVQAALRGPIPAEVIEGLLARSSGR